MAFPKPEEIPDNHAFRETRDLCPLDMELRKAGFHIDSRPKHGEPYWIRGGKHYVQSEAVKEMRLEQNQSRRAMDQIHKSGEY